MLGSISPFGERTRNQRWALTVGAYIVASSAAGAALGWGLGSAGRAAILVTHPGAAPRAAILVATIAAGIAADAGFLPFALPTVHRQVNEEWLGRYRGWVYGAGFGIQLGLGVATIVTTSAVYATWVAAALSGSALGGLAIGATYGFVRSGGVLLTARATSASGAYRVDGWVQRRAVASHGLALGLQGAIAAAAAVALIR